MERGEQRKVMDESGEGTVVEQGESMFHGVVKFNVVVS